MNAKITLKQSLLDINNFEYDESAALLATSAVIRGAKITPVDEYCVYEFEAELLPFNIFKQIEPLLTKVENYPIFLKIDDINSEVPIGIPNRDEIDEMGNILGVKKWKDWKKSNYEFTKIGEYYYISTEASSDNYVSPSLFPNMELLDLKSLKNLQTQYNSET